MRRSYLTVTAVALALGAAGCHTRPQYNPGAVGDPNCAPADDCPDDIVVHAPQKRYVVKVPANCPPDAVGTPATPAAPVGAPAPPQGMPMGFGSPVGYGQPGFGYGMQPMMPAPAFGAVGAGMGNTTVTTSQKTRIALTTTTIRISLPWFKLMPVTDAPETTIRITGGQTIQQPGFGMPMGVMPMGFGAAGAFPGAAGSMVMGQVVGPPVGGGTFGVAQPPAGGAAFGAGVCPPCPPVDPAITPERVQAMAKRIEELEAAKRAREAAEGKKGEAPAPKEKLP